ncbi:MAG: hypothetical protein J6P31_00070 [Oscillospiraceae bacterium]|nr:hypothetical protein [Oscillospiraceae bacterium]
MSKLAKFLLFAVDVALLIWIITSYQEQKREEFLWSSVPPAAEETSQEVSDWPSSSDYRDDIMPETETWYGGEDPLMPDGDYSQGGVTPGGDSGQGTAFPESLDWRDYSNYEKTTLEDMLWITEDYYRGNVPSDLRRLQPDEIMGGWKAYIITDPEGTYDAMTESFLNLLIAPTPEESEPTFDLTFDWYYVYVNAEGEGYNDDAPDQTITGTWTGNGIYAQSAGSVSLNTFFYENGCERAVGTCIWSDGVPGLIFLSRP